MKRLPLCHGVLWTQSLLAMLLFSGCDNRTETERAIDKLGDKAHEVGEEVDDALQDAADNRPLEPVRDELEDLEHDSDAALPDGDREGIGEGFRKIGDGLKDVGREVATGAGQGLRKVGEKIEDAADDAQRQSNE